MTKALPGRPFVTLAEALSWIAFRTALDRMALNRELAGQAFGLGIDQAKNQLGDAVEALTTHAAKGGSAGVEIRGKCLKGHDVDPDGVKVKVIPAVEIDNYRQFDITIDGLRFGSGLAWLPDKHQKWVHTAHKHPSFLTEVTVKRSDLMRIFSGGVAGRSAIKKGEATLSTTDLQKWWSQLTPEEKALSQEAHFKMCSDAHPGLSIRAAGGLRHMGCRFVPRTVPATVTRCAREAHTGTIRARTRLGQTGLNAVADLTS